MLKGRRSSASTETSASFPVSPAGAMNTMALTFRSFGSFRTSWRTPHPSSFGSSASRITAS